MAEKDGRGPANGVVVALLIGGICGWFIGRMTAPQAAIAISERQAAPDRLDVVVGRGRREASYTMFPVTLSNQTGHDLVYAKVTCALYDKQGGLVGSAYTNWSNVLAFAKVSGEVSSRASNVSSAECRGSS